MLNLNLEERKQKIVDHLKYICSNWNYYEKIGMKQNRPFGVRIQDEDAELLTDYAFGLYGTGGKSHGNDHNDGSETKMVNVFQHKFCKSGGSIKQKPVCSAINKQHKVHYATEKCDLCGKSKFKVMLDTRANIDSKAHFEYNIPRYMIWVLLSENNVVNLKGYLVDSNDKFFIEVLKVQRTKGKKPGKNFMPYGLEWYFSNPLLFAHFKFNKVDEKNYDVNTVFFDIDSPISEVLKMDAKNNPVGKDVYSRKGTIKEEINKSLGVRNEYTYSEILEHNLIKLTWTSTAGKKSAIKGRRKQ